MHKHGLKVLGLAIVAAIGLMAFTASSAFAVTALNLGDEPYGGEAGEFLVTGTGLSPTGLTTQKIKGKQVGSGRLLIPGKSAEIVCSAGEVTAASIANEYQDFKAGVMKTGGHGTGTVLFKGCKVFKMNAATGALEGELTKCTEELNKASSPAGEHHVTASALIMVKKHDGKTYLVAYPLITSAATAAAVEGLTAVFTNIKFGGTCSLPESVNITGSISVAAPTEDAIKPSLAIKTFEIAGGVIKSSAEQVLVGTKLKFGANESFIEATAEAELEGKEVKWGAM